MQHTFETPDPVHLFVEIGTGSLTLHTAESTETAVTVTGQGADDAVVEQRGDEIVVLAPRRGGGFFGGSQQLDVHVALPHDSRVSTKLGSADLRVVGRLGETALKSGSGDMTLGELTGQAYVETGSGDVTVDVVGGPLHVKSGSGDVTVGVATAPVTVSTGSGDVRVDRTSAPVEARSGSGDLVVREAGTDVALSTASGDLVVGSVTSGAVTARNVSGDVRVGIPAGIPVWTDISSMTGSVRSSLQGAGEPADGQAYVELRAKTVSGDIALEER